MTTEQIFNEYRQCKSRLWILYQELEVLKRSPDFVKVTKYGEESKGTLAVEDLHLKLLDKRRELEMQIAIEDAFITKIDLANEVLKKEFGDADHQLFYLKHFKNKTLVAVAIECGYQSYNGYYKRLKKMESYFENLAKIK